jgi:hypothetical protein
VLSVITCPGIRWCHGGWEGAVIVGSIVKKVGAVISVLSTAVGIGQGLARDPGWSFHFHGYSFNVWLTLGLIGIFATLAWVTMGLRRERRLAEGERDAARKEIERLKSAAENSPRQTGLTVQGESHGNLITGNPTYFGTPPEPPGEEG